MKGWRGHAAGCSRLDQVFVHCNADGFGAVCSADFRKYRSYVVIDAVQSDAELPRYVAVGKPADH